MPATVARRAVLLTLATLTLIPFRASPTDAAGGQPWFPASGAFFGASVGRQFDETDPMCRDLDPYTGRTAFEGLDCAKQPTYIDHVFYRWDGKLNGDPWPTAYERWSVQTGHRLHINWIAKREDDSVVRWADIANGKYNAYIDAKARAVKNFGAPLYLTFHAEPEYHGAAGAFGTAADYRAAYRRIVDRFRAQGVTNVRWVPVLMAWSFSRPSGNPGAFWPGDAYVDAVGVDGYNWFGCTGGRASWNSFESIFQRAYDWVAARRRPMMVVEWGTVEDPDDPLRKAQWFTDAAEWIQDHPNIKAVEYFHARDINPSKNRDCDWTIDSSVLSQVAFANLATDPYFNPPSSLPDALGA